MKLERTVAPSAAISTADAKKHLRVVGTEDDDYIDALVQRATDYIEGYYGMSLAINEQTWEMSLDGFPSIIRIPIWPVKSISSIAYVDADGATQTLASSAYDADTKANPALIAPVSGSTLPQTKRQFNSVTVTFVAGFDTVPQDIIHAMLLLIAHWYENREAVNVGNITSKYDFAFDAIMSKYAARGFA